VPLRSSWGGAIDRIPLAIFVLLPTAIGFLMSLRQWHSKMFIPRSQDVAFKGRLSAVLLLLFPKDFPAHCLDEFQTLCGRNLVKLDDRWFFT
jgi:hypothetical protein